MESGRAARGGKGIGANVLDASYVAEHITSHVARIEKSLASCSV